MIQNNNDIFPASLIMPNYAQAAIQLRQNKERRAKDRGSRRQKGTPDPSNDSDPHNASAPTHVQVILRLC